MPVCIDCKIDPFTGGITPFNLDRLFGYSKKSGILLEAVSVQSPRNKATAERLMRTLLKRHGRPFVLVADNKLRNYAAMSDELGRNVEHGQHEELKNRADNSH
jgi:transposase-like protein